MLACRAFEIYNYAPCYGKGLVQFLQVSLLRLWIKLSPGFIGLWAFIVQGQNGARTLVAGLGPFQRYFPFICSENIVKLCF